VRKPEDQRPQAVDITVDFPRIRPWNRRWPAPSPYPPCG